MMYGIVTFMGEAEVGWFNTLAKANEEFNEFEKLGWEPVLVKVIKKGKPKKHIIYNR